jgi:hypothetical protein
LREAAASRGAENFEFHDDSPERRAEGLEGDDGDRTKNGPPSKAGPTKSRKKRRLEFGVRVGTDFAVQVNFFMLWCGPFHWVEAPFHANNVPGGTKKKIAETIASGNKKESGTKHPKANTRRK